jgi:predicted glycosyltransferase involved in capsule biosynthesis
MTPVPDGISVVVPITSSRFVPYLRNCLASILAQTCDPELVDLTIVYTFNTDTTEYPDKLEQLAQLCQHHSAALVFQQHDFPDFPLAFTRNVGARRAMRRILGFVDADLVLDPEMFEAVFDVIHPTGAAYAHVYRMDRGPDDPIFQQLEVEQFRANLEGRCDPAGRGGCFFIDRSTFFKIGGYDERFYGWGYEDNDILRRLENARVPIAPLLERRLVAMHQYHEHKINHAWRAETNRDLMATEEIQRNPEGWGGVVIKPR